MSRSPDFILKALNKVTEARSGKIGALWRNENGSMTLVLDVALLPDPNTLYTLFPNDRGEVEVESTKPRARKKKKPTTMAELPVSAFHRINPS